MNVNIQKFSKIFKQKITAIANKNSQFSIWQLLLSKNSGNICIAQSKEKLIQLLENISNIALQINYYKIDQYFSRFINQKCQWCNFSFCIFEKTNSSFNKVL